tara:strand:- start:860 stop:1282 length:423 start_codon:yes stop_codon:yes gene_type:complete
MKVRCLANNFLELKNKIQIDRLLKVYFGLPNGELNLRRNQEYTVYGILYIDKHPWYFLCLDKYDEYPVTFPADLFEIIEPSLSSYWRLVTHNSDTPDIFSGFVIPEWSENESFYENLVDGDPKSEAIFTKYRKLMDEEFN